MSVESREISEGVVLDYDAAGNLVGIDIDNASTKVEMGNLVVNTLPVTVETFADAQGAPTWISFAATRLATAPLVPAIPVGNASPINAQAQASRCFTLRCKARWRSPQVVEVYPRGPGAGDAP